MDTARTKEDTPNLNLTPTDAEEAPAAASSPRRQHRQVLQLADSPDHEEEAEGHRETIQQAHISELSSSCSTGRPRRGRRSRSRSSAGEEEERKLQQAKAKEVARLESAAREQRAARDAAP